jgi:FlaA1/EpsC-like NDP-sugar epimerase
VLEVFRAQAAAGGPTTVTHPEVTRYFMTVGEAVQLLIQAAVIGADSEVLVLDMGEPVAIADLAAQIASEHDDDIDIVYSGLRPGEKLHEQLFADHELGVARHHPLISHVAAPALEWLQVQATLAHTNGDLPDTLRELAAATTGDGAHASQVGAMSSQGRR